LPNPPPAAYGEVVAVDGLKLQVMTRGGERIAIDLDDKYAVTAVAKTDIASIKPGSSKSPSDRHIDRLASALPPRIRHGRSPRAIRSSIASRQGITSAMLSTT
jgi:hypothetical protein